MAAKDWTVVRTSNWLIYLVCLLALGLYGWSFHGQQEVGALPESVQVESLPMPVTVAGATAASADEVRFLVQGHPAGSRILLESSAGSRIVAVQPAFSRLHLRITFVIGLFFWGICLFVFAGRSRVEWARVLFWGTLSYGLAIMVGGVYFPPRPLWPAALRPVLRTSAITLTATMFVHLGLVFPRRRAVVERHPRLLYALYALAVVLIAWQSAAILRYLASPGPASWRTLLPTEVVSDLYLVVVVVAGCLLLWQSTRSAQLTRDRQQAKWVWWGITVGATPFVFLYTAPQMLGLPELIPLPVARVFAIVVPTAFAVAVARYQFMDIDLIIRRSLIYGALAGVLVGVYLLLAVLIGRRVEMAVPETARYVPFAAALVALALFRPTRRWIGVWVDRTFFKIRSDYALALQSFRASLGDASGQGDLADLVLALVLRTLAPKTVAVAVRTRGELLISGNIQPPVAARWLDALEGMPGVGEQAIAATGATSLPEIERVDFPGDGGDPPVLLVQPLVSAKTLLGAILLGEKETERRYIEQDIELLAGTASLSAVALERMDLVQKVAEESIVRRRLDEINRLKSDFLSRVAHDLRTPLTSIAWSTDNLLDGVAGPLAKGQQEYLQAVQLSARQLGRLVDNLLEIARLEEGRVRVELAPVQMASTIDEAATALRPIAEAKQVRLLLECEPGLACVRGDRQRLVEVVMNLLENAIKYSPPGGDVKLTLRRSSPGEQELAVRDCGPGIPPGEEQALFERFRQGTPSPHTRQQGFGIGLYVVKSFVEMFGGSVAAANDPAGGARFTCLLRDWSPAGSGSS